MKPILKIKIAVDAAMSVSMLLLMAYGLVGEAAHEWIGMGMFALFVAHHILNRKWLLAVGKGKYTPIRMVQTALVGIIFLSMSGSMISGVVLSRYVFAVFSKHGGYELAQQVHILCAYWGFVCMSLHLGFHWSMMLAMARKHLQPSQNTHMGAPNCRIFFRYLRSRDLRSPGCGTLPAAEKPFRVL